MATVPEHDRKQERKCYDGVKSWKLGEIRSKFLKKLQLQTWIAFAITCHSIDVDQVLEPSGELVGSVKSRRHFTSIDNVEKRWNGASAGSLNHQDVGVILDYVWVIWTYRSITQGFLNNWYVVRRHPTFSNKALLGHVHVKQIQCMVDCFHFAHHDAPILNLFGYAHLK